MRKIFVVCFAAFAMAACAQDTAAPTADTLLLDDAAVLAYGAMDMADPGRHFIARLNSLPDSIKLSSQQRTQIRDLISNFMNANRADMEALAAIHEEARAARQAGASAEEIRAIFARGDDARGRLHAAEAELRADIDALLTPAQRAWLNHAPIRREHCADPSLRLTEAQHTQITALIAAFETANRADLEAIKLVHEEARAAVQAGATRERVAEILAQASAPMQRVRAARETLQAAIRAVFTPAQLASGCFGMR